MRNDRPALAIRSGRFSDACTRLNDASRMESYACCVVVVRGYQCCGSTPHEVCDDPAQLDSGVLLQEVAGILDGWMAETSGAGDELL